MKRVIFSFVSLLVLVSCGSNNSRSQDSTTSTDSTTVDTTSQVVEEQLVEDAAYMLDTTRSGLIWIGRKTGGEHTGELSPKIGLIGMSKSGQVIHGVVEVDMTSITVTDIEDKEKNAKLVAHLKNEDFFDVANFPSASFSLSGFQVVKDEEANESGAAKEGGEKFHATGEIYIKDKFAPIDIEGNSEFENEELHVKGVFTFDRTMFDIKYKSKTVFPELADKFIHDEVEVEYDLYFTKVKE